MIGQMGSPDNFSTDLSESLHFETLKEAYCSRNQVSFEEKMLWYNDRYTRLAYMIQNLEYLVLQGCCDWQTTQTIPMNSGAE
jgi:hypothetical protein